MESLYRRNVALMGVAAIAIAATVATAGAASSGPAAAKKLVAQYTAAQKPIGLTPLKRKPKAGLKVGFIGCTIPVCGAAAAQSAAHTLGWKYERQDFTFTPQSYIQAWERAMQNPPDVMIYQGVFPNSLVAKQLAELKSKKIPTVTVTTTAPTLRATLVPPTSACLNCSPQFSLSGRLMAAAIAANAGPKANVLFVNDATLAAAQIGVQSQLAAGLKAFSPGSSLATLNINSSGPAAQVSSSIITYLQSHKNVKYLAFALASYENGVPQALKSAGLDKQVKLVSRAPQAANIANVKSGVEFAQVAEESPESVWRSFDAVARLQQGMKLTDPAPAGWHQIVTKANAGKFRATAPGFPGSFLKAWHEPKVVK